MARKIRLAYIPNYIARKTSFKKRKVGIVKKLHELTTLCAIKACAIMYSAFDPEPFVWPSIDEARRLIEKFKSFSAGDQRKRKVNQETYMRQSLEKLEEKLRRMQMENRRKEITHIMFQALVDTQGALSRLDMGGYVELRKAINKKIMEAQRMIDLRSREEEAGSGSGGGQNQLVSSHGFILSPIPSSNMTLPPRPTMQFPTTNMPFPPPLSSQYMHMPPNPNGFYGPNFSMPNLMFPPPSQGNVGGGQEQGLSHHEFMSDHPNQPSIPRFSNVTFPPPSMNFPPNDMDPNTGMPYPSNQPMFPYYRGPHDPSFH